MPRCFALTVATIVFATIILQTACFRTAAQAQDEGIKCDAFYKNPDGSWTATQPVYLPGTRMVSRIGGVFRPGVSVDGYDVAAALDKGCPNPATSPPAATRPQQPYVSLSNAADANGAIDVARLTCGHLADTSDEEAGLLLAWYGYAPSGPTNRRIFNMARLRSAIHTIVDYCKTHRDQNLVKAMERVLK
jgi:hypothetical protein